MTARTTTTPRALELHDLRGCTDVANLFALWRKLRYPVEAPVNVGVEAGELPGQLRDAVAERYQLAEIAAGADLLTVTLFVVRQVEFPSAVVRGIAQLWPRRFVGNHLLVFAQMGTDGQFGALTFVNTRRLGEGAHVRVKLYKLIVDRAHPTRHDLDTLNAIALPTHGMPTPAAIYQMHCDAFDVERITNEFYREYARRFKLAKERILRENQAIAALHDPAKLHTFTQRLFGRLMFLYFLQKKGALNGRPDFVTHHYKEAVAAHENFYRHILEPLFFQTLNQPRANNLSPIFGRVPYLNGGLFSPDPDDLVGQVYLADEIFDPNTVDGLLYFLNNHNFTVAEDTPLEVEVALDPEMLGKVFENLLEAEERGQSGTFYTPRPVVAFMCREALAAYLQRAVPQLASDHLGWLLDEAETGEPARDDANHERLTPKTLNYATRATIDHALSQARVLDPAVGSGAFPLGMLALLVGVRRALFRIGEAVIAPGANIVEGWKRDFIRDCLYGVDIKREAIEIARLRLWLALVVDADPKNMEPLPNLDYKLMDGDSLIETFDGVEIFPTRPVSGTGPTQVSDDMSATPRLVAQLHALQDQYFAPDGAADRAALKAQIRDTEVQIVTEQLAARKTKLVNDIARIVRQLGFLQGRQETKAQQAELARLRRESEVIADTEARLERGESLPFFLFRLHFGNVFAEKDGFDIVIANPPYVRHERVARDTLAAIKAGYPEVAHGMADLYVYFYARALQLLHAQGALAFVTSNKFFRAGYGEKLRALLTTATTVRDIIDFGDAPVFDAAAYPCIVITDKGAPAPDHALRGLTAANDIDLDKLAQIVSATGQHLPQAEGAHPPASSAATSALVAKLLRLGAPLGEFVGGKMYYGIKTGLNAAFVIDDATRDRLIAADPQSAAVIKPFLRGRDVGRYAIHPAGLWLIFTRQGTDIDRYPAIKAHLEQWREQLEPKPRSWGDAPDWPGRKAGPYQWYEIQDAVDYYAAFEGPKIVYRHFAQWPTFAYDTGSHLINDKGYILDIEGRTWLLAYLNSTFSAYIISQLSPPVRGGFFEHRIIYMSQLPIVEPNDADKARLAALVDELQALGGQGPQAEALEREADTIVFRAYGLTDAEIAEIARWHAERRATLGAGKKRGQE